MSVVFKARREWFGAVVYSESPGFTAFVDRRGADELGLPPGEGLADGLFSAPLDVHMSLTSRCNLACAGCYARRPGEPGVDMPEPLARAILDRLADLEVLTVALGGGEPLLHPALFAIAGYARSRRVVPNLTTNGLLLDAPAARACRVFGSVHVSCHEAAELGRLEGAVRLLRREGIDPGLNVLVSARTWADLPRIWGWCARAGVSRVLALKLKPAPGDASSGAMALPAELERGLVPLVRRLSRRHGIMPLLDCSLFPALAAHGPRMRDVGFFDVNGCQGGNAFAAVTEAGLLKPCSFSAATCGEAASLTREAWRTDPVLVAFRRARPNGACAGCRYEGPCNGGCRMSATPWCRPAAV